MMATGASVQGSLPAAGAAVMATSATWKERSPRCGRRMPPSNSACHGAGRRSPKSQPRLPRIRRSHLRGGVLMTGSPSISSERRSEPSSQSRNVPSVIMRSVVSPMPFLPNIVPVRPQHPARRRRVVPDDAGAATGGRSRGKKSGRWADPVA